MGKEELHFQKEDYVKKKAEQEGLGYSDGEVIFVST